MSQDFTQPLIQAAEGGDLPTVQALLALDADPNSMGPNSGALHCAAFGGFVEVVQALLAAGADPNLADVKGFYPLQLAASKSHLPVMKVLILAKANLEAKTPHGGTALHVAAASNFPDAVRMLLEVNADIEARDAGGNTPLATTCGLGALEAFEVLKKAGANKYALSDAKETLLIKAARSLRTLRVKNWSSEGTILGKPVSYLLQNGMFTFIQDGKSEFLDLNEQAQIAAQPWGPKAHLAYVNAVKLVQILLEWGFKPNEKDVDGNTAFSLTCHSGNGYLIEMMLKAGAKTTLDHEEGFQPIHLVSGSERIDGLRSFLSKVHGLDANVPDKYGWTPLHWLADMGGDVQMVKLLMKRGADKRVKTTLARGANMPAGLTPEDVARHWRDTEMAEALKP
ncbi:MAG: ankyrin repeat domain-containing protein [Bacteroidetes bacterium]|nr:ankyrin repeat domain-containing protein [Bacteroidota bacterium]